MELLLELFTRVKNYYKDENAFPHLYNFALIYKNNIPDQYPEKFLKEEIVSFLDKVILEEKVDKQEEISLKKRWIIKYAHDLIKQTHSSSLTLETLQSIKELVKFLYSDSYCKLKLGDNFVRTLQKDMIEEQSGLPYLVSNLDFSDHDTSEMEDFIWLDMLDLVLGLYLDCCEEVQKKLICELEKRLEKCYCNIFN